MSLLSVAIEVALWCYALAIALSTVRLFKGPTAQDRVLAFDHIYINGMLVMLGLGLRHASGMYFEAALLIGLFGFFGAAALAKFLLRGEVIE